MRRVRRAEHLRADREVRAPDAAEALVEALGVERLDALPVAVEALGPRVERQRVMAAQVLDVEHLEPVCSIATIASARLGIQPPGKMYLRMKNSVSQRSDVADEMDHAEAARLERVGMRADHLGELVAPGVLQRADRHHLVVLARDFAEVALDNADAVRQALPRELSRSSTTCSVVR